ncbi:DUF5134 domain-containing protein [Streptomyces sp. NBC_00654]|uniref:DUF5134 domain-containing protein n=1 Tax=Streptomyces sp. NBC_00654 TaxID=2975799 RepID=UPI002258D17D|nr:DUF5134 domain-containing protein [Streptomyces sp. NBC_00654]MCX4967843.1 DUF5134 domain-containing protein [Streptomyces sp. NBC_00654]
MHGPALTGWLLMVLCGVTGAYCLLRTRSGGPQERSTARAEALMGFGMAAMAVPAAVLTPPAWAWAVYAALFGGAALRAMWSVRRGGHHLHHLVGSLAMVYMALMMAPGITWSGGHAGHGAPGPAAPEAGGIPLLTGALLVYYAFYVLRSAGRLIPVAVPAGGTGGFGGAGGVGGAGPARGAGGTGGGWGDRPELTLACRLTMGMAMFAMLLTL